ncbi:unnamed protein product [Adineta ricciae]|uniref:Uncharacterized protein n=1 Tax=Adineta ricciae TaxID=249248 RepID=A0A815IUS7_ADIRI|nr:unnamed protein product [Adineta ricciae]CAF1371363.1 unnamed protein product [Adineta ricciae]
MKKRTLQTSSRLLTTNNRSINKLLSNIKSQERSLQLKSYLTPQYLHSPVNDEHSTISNTSQSIPNMNPSIDFEQLSTKDNLQEDVQLSEISSRKYRTTRSITSSSSTSKNSRDEPLLAPDTLIVGNLYLLNELYPSIDHEQMNGAPLAFLGAEKLLRTRIDWRKVQYLLSAYHIELIIDLILSRPSFIREIPKVINFSLYRSLIRTVSGRLFFDSGENKAGTHQCDRKQINRKFTVEDLASIHRREFHIINSNTTHEQRFISLCENLFPIYSYQSQSNHWKSYLNKSIYHPASTSDIVSDITTDNSEIQHINTLLTLNRTFSPSVKSSSRRSSHSRKSIPQKQIYRK